VPATEAGGDEEGDVGRVDVAGVEDLLTLVGDEGCSVSVDGLIDMDDAAAVSWEDWVCVDRPPRPELKPGSASSPGCPGADVGVPDSIAEVVVEGALP
jgi:hypothetical protein